MPSATEDYSLTDEQKQFWLEHGFLKIPKCFSREAAEAFTSSIWVRLGASPTDKSTWPTEKLNMPGHVTVSVKEFAPKAYATMCELVGGEDRIADWCKEWKDGFIVNLGKPEYKPDDPLDYRTLDNWHNDGDWFVHFLDSPEQALLVIPLFTDIMPKGGVRPSRRRNAIPRTARHTRHPRARAAQVLEQLDPEPRTDARETFFEATGEVGDVYLLHPFMLHSASKNLLRNPRIITNPPVALKEPFNYNRSDPSEYSLVEQKTLRDLGRPEGLPEWKITAPRERLVPLRVKKQEEMKRKELERLAKEGVPVNKLGGKKLLDQLYPS
ncbi:Uncharacterized protein T310_2268 [Rasamsonia emersonii CBS 393.64]|uniref:Phytanoyl-CoA dioxygenase n=1 Tax=Rasamsonia emersonii (strain ATCC 16479 / CBS 393.64 / IMI 116815) TaxID=1408163 RepID=A0A0F4YZI1_RASE3|nr:Uncharacterized protein T310_2268 [Rasamsonia emersonii CBS 393.64]KKA23677.1 Uncharacterized protein T310_2268 [Rasamsonia emersonii CBS 393.64]